jgi:hypothetical protein
LVRNYFRTSLTIEARGEIVREAMAAHASRWRIRSNRLGGDRGLRCYLRLLPFCRRSDRGLRRADDPESFPFLKARPQVSSIEPLRRYSMADQIGCRCRGNSRSLAIATQSGGTCRADCCSLHRRHMARSKVGALDRLRLARPRSRSSSVDPAGFDGHAVHLAGHRHQH